MSTKAFTAIVLTIATAIICVICGTGLLGGAAASACTPTTTASISAAPQPSTSTSQSTGAATPAGCLDAATVLARAETWLTAWNGGPVPYLMSSDPATWFRGYRRDCSGYVSYALGLPGPGLDTAGLQAHSVPLTKHQVAAGDLLINSSPGGAGHVVLFERWADQAHTVYIGYEQAGDAGTLHRAITWPYDNGYPIEPFRFLN